MSYDEADSLADNFGRGLRVLSLKPEDNICLFADTRAEWMISAQVSDAERIFLKRILCIYLYIIIRLASNNLCLL